MSECFDNRFVYGFCSFVGSIHQVGNSDGLPCCPHCGSMLLELPTKEDYLTGVPEYDKKHPGYAEFVNWNIEASKTRCFPSLAKAIEIYNKETGKTVKL